MFIAIDIGNTHTVIGIYKNETLSIDFRISNSDRQTKKKIGKYVQSLLTKAGISKKGIDGIGISSVVPDLTDVYSSLSRDYFNQKPLLVSARLDLGMTIHYKNSRTLGADRICNAVAGYRKYGGPLIIIDFGTATTYDVVSSRGEYLGGVIAPGIETSAADLHRRTAQLPSVDLHLPRKIIGTDTRSSMQSGILWSAIDAMAGMVNRIQMELRQSESKKATVLATGGFSKFVAKNSGVIQHVETSLVLDGIRIIYQRERRKDKR
jgi:type III pantothenate kinase